MEQHFTEAENATNPALVSETGAGNSSVPPLREWEHDDFCRFLRKTKNPLLRSLFCYDHKAKTFQTRFSLTPLQAEDLHTLLRDTRESRWQERILACFVLQHTSDLPASQRDAIASRLTQILDLAETPTHKRLARRTWIVFLHSAWWLFCSSLPFVLITVLNFCMPEVSVVSLYGSVWFPFIMLVLLLSFLGSLATVIVFPASWGMEAGREMRVRMAAAATLGTLCYPGATTALAKATLAGSPDLHTTAFRALYRTLPTLTADHYGTLGSDLVPVLCRLLGKDTLFHSTDYVKIAGRLLDALEKVGDGRAVETVARIAARSLYPAVRERAAEVLPILEARRQAETQQGTLLRSSVAPTAGADELLRAASDASSTPPEQLLRPGT